MGGTVGGTAWGELCGRAVGGLCGGTVWGELCGGSCVYIWSCGGTCVRGAVWRYVAVWGRTVDSPTLGGPLQSVPTSPTACSSACAPSSSLFP